MHILYHNYMKAYVMLSCGGCIGKLDSILILMTEVQAKRNKHFMNDSFQSQHLHFSLFQILSMIEEAAGTRMYESKKMSAQKTIGKKDAKLKEIEVVSPTLGVMTLRLI